MWFYIIKKKTKIFKFINKFYNKFKKFFKNLNFKIIINKKF